MSFPLQLP